MGRRERGAGRALKPHRPGKAKPNTSRAEEMRAYLYVLLHGPSADFIPISEWPHPFSSSSVSRPVNRLMLGAALGSQGPMEQRG